MRVETVWWAIAAVVSIAGLVTLLVGLRRPASFGWFACSPLSAHVSPAGGVVVLTTTALVGVVILILGLLALAFLGGRRIGHLR